MSITAAHSPVDPERVGSVDISKDVSPAVDGPGAAATDEFKDASLSGGVSFFRDNIDIFASDPDPETGKIEAKLNFFAANGTPIMLVHVRGITDYQFSSAIEPLYNNPIFVEEGEETRKLHSTDSVHRLLLDLESKGARLLIKGEVRGSRHIADFYEQELEKDPFSGPCETRTIEIRLKPEKENGAEGPEPENEQRTSPRTLRWQRLDNPAIEELRKFASDHKIKPEDLEPALLHNTEPGVTIRDDHMVVALNEVVVNPEVKGAFTRRPIFLFINGSELVSITHHRSYVLDRVADEFEKDSNPLPHKAGLSWVAARILGSVIHRADDMLAELHREVTKFQMEQLEEQKTKKTDTHLLNLINSANEIQLSMHAVGEAIEVLQRERVEFEEQTPKPSLRRYPGRIESIHIRLGQVKETIEDIRARWRDNEQQTQTEESFRLRNVGHKIAVLGAVSAPPALTMGFFQILPHLGTDVTKVVALGASGFISAALIAGIHTFNGLSGKRKESDF